MEWICGNGIAEIRGKIVTIGLWQCHCQNRREKICGNCGNVIAENVRKKKLVIAEIWGGIKKKKSATFTIFLQQITCD